MPKASAMVKRTRGTHLITACRSSVLTQARCARVSASCHSARKCPSGRPNAGGTVDATEEAAGFAGGKAVPEIHERLRRGPA